MRPIIHNWQLIAIQAFLIAATRPPPAAALAPTTLGFPVLSPDETAPSTTDYPPFDKEQTTSTSQASIREQIKKDLAALIIDRASIESDAKELQAYIKELLNGIAEQEKNLANDVDAYLEEVVTDDTKEQTKRAREALSALKNK